MGRAKPLCDARRRAALRELGDKRRRKTRSWRGYRLCAGLGAGADLGEGFVAGGAAARGAGRAAGRGRTRSRGRALRHRQLHRGWRGSDGATRRPARAEHQCLGLAERVHAHRHAGARPARCGTRLGPLLQHRGRDCALL